MLDTTAQPFSLTRTLLVVLIFVVVTAIAVVAVELDHKHAVKKEMRRRAYETLQHKAELRRQKEQEAADDYLLDKIQEYRNDFDDDLQAG
jgi:cell division protein FtsL